MFLVGRLVLEFQVTQINLEVHLLQYLLQRFHQLFIVAVNIVSRAADLMTQQPFDDVILRLDSPEHVGHSVSEGMIDLLPGWKRQSGF